MVWTRRPGWVRPGAKYDLDFANGRYYGGSVAFIPSYISSGALVNGPAIYTPVYVPDRTGVLRTFPIYVPSITDGMGLWAWPSYTNYALWNRDLTNAVWLKTNATVVKTQTGADALANQASAITATAANATVSQAITVASTAFVNTAHIKRLTGSGAVLMSLDGTTFTDVTSQINNSTYSFVPIPTQTLANPSITFQLATSGDSIAVDFVQCQNLAVPCVAVCATTNASIVNNNAEPVFGTLNGPSDGQRVCNDVFANGSPFSIVAAYSGTPISGAGWLMASDGVANMSGGCNGGPFVFQGATSPTGGVAGRGNINRVAGRVNGKGSVCCINGGPLSGYVAGQGPYGPAFRGTHIGIGNNGAGNGPGSLNGYIARLTLWNKEISDGQMIEFTR